MRQLTDRESDVGVLAAGDVDHSIGDVNADGLETVVGKQSGGAAGSTTGIENTAAGRLCGLGEAGEEREVGGRLDLLRQGAANEVEVSIRRSAVGTPRAPHSVHR
jgi:hypothetical protein